jgi:hypothetical protein
MPQTNNNTTQSPDAQTAIFIDSLVQALLGYSIAQIPAPKQAQSVEMCLKYFTTFIEEFVSKNFGGKDALRLKASLQFAGNEIFEKFADLGEHFDQAYEAFLSHLEAKTI